MPARIRSRGLSSTFEPRNFFQYWLAPLGAFEIFWFVNVEDVSLVGQHIVDVRRSDNNNPLMSWHFTDWDPIATHLRCEFSDRSGVTPHVVDFAIPAGQLAGIWYHSVITMWPWPHVAGTSQWWAGVGRTAVTSNNSLNPNADSMPYPLGQYLPIGAAQANTNHPFWLMGARYGTTAGAVDYHVCCGAAITADGQGYVAGTNLNGGFAEMRWWSVGYDPEPTPGSPPTPSEFERRRNIYVRAAGDPGAFNEGEASESYPGNELRHCFRFNEPSAADPIDFDDVGDSQGRFDDTASANGSKDFTGSAFLSTPIQEPVGGVQVDLQNEKSGKNNALSSEGPVELGRLKDLFVVPDAAASSDNTPVLGVDQNIAVVADAAVSSEPGVGPLILKDAQLGVVSDAAASSDGAAPDLLFASEFATVADTSDADEVLLDFEKAFATTPVADDAAASELLLELIKSAEEFLLPDPSLAASSEAAFDNETARIVEAVTDDASASEADDLIDTYNFGNANSAYPLGFFSEVGHVFQGNGEAITAIRVRMFRPSTNTPAGLIQLDLRAVTGTYGVDAEPTGPALAVAAEAVDPATVPVNVTTTYEFTFPTPFQTVAGTPYAFRLFGILGSIGTRVDTLIRTGTGSHPGNAFYFNSGYVTTANDDFVFEVLGGPKTKVEKESLFAPTTATVTATEGVVELVVDGQTLLQPVADTSLATEAAAVPMYSASGMASVPDTGSSAQLAPDIITGAEFDVAADLAASAELLAELTSQGQVVFTPLADLSLAEEGAPFVFSKSSTIQTVAELVEADEGFFAFELARLIDTVANTSVASELTLDFQKITGKLLTPAPPATVVASEGALDLERLTPAAFDVVADTALATEGTPPVFAKSEILGTTPADYRSVSTEVSFDTVTAGEVPLAALPNLATSSDPVFQVSLGRELASVADLAQAAEVVFADALTKAFVLDAVANTSLASELSVDMIDVTEVPLTPLVQLSLAAEGALDLGRSFQTTPEASLVTAAEGVVQLRESARMVPTANTALATEAPVDMVVAGRVIHVPNPSLAQASEPTFGLSKAARFDDAAVPVLAAENTPDIVGSVEFDVKFELVVASELVFQLVSQGEVPFALSPDTSQSIDAGGGTSALKTSLVTPTTNTGVSHQFLPETEKGMFIEPGVSTGGSGEGGVDINVIIPTDLIPPPDLSTSSEAGVGVSRLVKLTPEPCLSLSSEPAGASNDFFSLLLLESPNHYWRMDETAGTVAADGGTDGDGTGTYIDVALGQSGVISDGETSVGFTIDFARVQANSNTSWETALENDSWTIGAWFEIDDFSNVNEQWLFRKIAFADVRIDDNGVIYARRTTATPSTFEIQSAPSTIKLRTPYFVCLVFDRVIGGGMRLYVNGALVASDSFITGQNAGVFAQPFRVGTDTDVSGEPFNGRIHHAFMFEGRALTPTEVFDLSNPTITSGMVATSIDRGMDHDFDASASAGAGGGVAVGRRMVDELDFGTSDESGFDFGLAGPLEGFVGIIDEIEDGDTPPVCDLEAYLSKLDIWNVGLTKLGLETLTATTDNVEQALAMAANWDLFKGQFLRDHMWNGAITTVTLSKFQDTSPVADVVPTGPWAYAYLLPDTVGREWVRSLRINGKENRPGDKSRSGKGLWTEEVVWNDAGTAKLCLLTDESDVKLEYIFLVSDNDIDALLSKDLQWAMALTFAAHMAADLGSSTADINQLEAQAEVARRNARRTDGQSGAKVQYLDTTIADSFY